MNDHYIFARIVQQFLPGVRLHQSLSPQQASTCQNILNCHTAKLGGLDYVCDQCQQHFPRYHSCRHRHCPQCQQKASEQWVEKRMADVLPLSYFHLVFTLPHELNAWAQLHPSVIYHLLFQCTWDTLNQYSKHNKQLQGQLGMISVLHSWGQNLNQHIHLHCLIPGGAIDNDNTFNISRRDYLYPHKVLAKLFRGKMVSALRKAHKNGKLHRIKQAQQVDDVLNALMRKDWVINTKPHIKKPETVVRYLGRYTYRSAISLSRLQSVDKTSVSFRWLDYRDNTKKCMTLLGEEFLRRFLLHVLPKGFMRIRHYGYLANRVRVKQIKKIRDWLNIEQTTKVVISKQTTNNGPLILTASNKENTEHCPKCKTGYLRLIGEI
ncbi:MAG: IS91 family transposase, partial [Gammaproteobacteria bacterium]